MPPVTERAAREMLNRANTHNLDVILDDYAEDAVLQMPGQPKPLVGKHAIREFEQANYKAFPDWTMTVKTVAVSGNEVLVVGSGQGTHAGPLTGYDGKVIEPTHQKVVIEGVTHIVFDDAGKIKSFRLYGDPLAIRAQLGLPVPAF